ncbi:zinc finger CCCH domain-containing protein 11A [Betta splendens]|uniref:Zinc finger CCCH domain-containing protein 11A n=1 Tax=Betta splendens TaxID=158456 RepID=A0A6P7MLC6_BETSP|nr:zinc finger CCCH domain-containing protein 11A [Betta splendens]XP_029006701.1 zinc finger CCCH domain-containing protein 11A [Betta splendens]XP_029006702.1 zinc finger CCCH domain-containing protein 11A [Betta splendens]XP_029006704.1 zinc finger CCCH domain-containing protein 11A [Betta splendens]XP_029006705.1 zinc finger CCCH domain-containing protein 11A [Betta splendens]XP_029006706.1 zinc finger CCCH domain-containing protein 11A [Betta splendens]
MTSNGDDCYFFYYSTCTKGDSCPFRHCEAAMGNETVCNLWQEGRCFRTVCKFRHMEITKNRKEIPCYWENQPAGCQKPHCAFSHEKPRYIDGVFVPPNKSLSKNDEQPDEEPAPPPAAPIPTPANPQIRGVMKTETQEPVPSPTHPPVVINPADDDEDEDDQFSEEGEESKLALSPKKIPKSDDCLNFGVSTLEEIRLRKALKASMKRAGYPIQSANTSANGEKENIHLTFFQEALFDVREETGRSRPSMTDRLGRKLPSAGKKSGEGFPLKRSLAERLGRVVAEEESSVPPPKALKPVRQRIGLPASAATPTKIGQTNIDSNKPSEQIYIKTLEEIRQEKAAKSQFVDHADGSSAVVPEISKTINTKGEKGSKRAITVGDDSIGQIKMFTEIAPTKKRKQEDQNISIKSQGDLNAVGSSSEAANIGEVRVKTLEEIRKEKAARMQGHSPQQTEEAGNKRSSETEENCDTKPRLLRVNKLASQRNATPETPESTEMPVKTCTAVPETSSACSNIIKVKTFDEIMQEKRLRKQKIENRTRTSAEAKPSEEQASDVTLKRKAPAEINSASPSSLSTSSNTPDINSVIQKLPIRKLIPLKSKTGSSVNSFVTSDTAAASVTSVSVEQSEPENHLQSSREVPDKKTSKTLILSLATDRNPTADTIHNKNQKTSSKSSTNTKVRPKLNVKPSVVKPAVQVKPGQKRKGAERSAVAAVKPLNSTPTVQEPIKESQVFPSFTADAQLSSAVPHTPSTLLDSGSNSSPLKEELQTVPVFKQSPSHEAKQAVSVAACTVPQSPILKSPVQAPKTRRQSMGMSRTTSASGAAASSSAVDDFEELISEFADDHLEEDIDPGLGEDDLLQELSEMIDS